MNLEPEQINFFSIIGAQRSGTTYLYKMLDQHPEIEMNSQVKPEPKFFLQDHKNSMTPVDYFKRYFSHTKDQVSIYGEKSTSYLEYAAVADNIYSLFPDGKILVVLRNPVHRAVSNYTFSLASKIESREIEQALVLENEEELDIPEGISVSPYAYISRGIYINYLKPYLKTFGKNIKVLLFEELAGNLPAIQNIYKFLEVDPHFIPTEYTKSVNSSPTLDVPKALSQKLNRFYEPYNVELSRLLNISLDKWK